MILGEYHHSLDSKHRLTIPAKFRDLLADGVVVTLGFDQNLMLYPLDAWDALAQSVLSKPISDPQTRDFRRRLFAGADNQTLDRSGRILIPQGLREFAQIESDVIVIGMYNYAEIWSPAAWQEIKSGVTASGDAERWSSLGI